MPRQPNVVFIISDQHKRSAMGCAGNSIVRTPHLDQLTREGVCFDRAYTPSPLCAPARAALITAALPSRNGALTHQIRSADGRLREPGVQRFPGIREEMTTVAQRFAEVGYRTAAIGKMHVHGETAEWRLGFEENALRFYSFRYAEYEAALCPADPELGRRKRLAYIAGKEDGFDADFTAPTQYNNAEGCPTTVPPILAEREMFDEMVTERALEFIRRRRDEPFFIHLGLEKPHPPWTETERWISQYSPEAIPQEHLPQTRHEGPKPYVPGWTANHPGDERICRGLAGYYACVSSMDEKVGRVVAEIERLGLREDTIIVYTSDHGEMAWEHGQVEKHCMLEAAVNIPLIFSWRGHLPEGEGSEALASLVDLGPTLCELCGLEPAASFQGISLAKALRQPREAAAPRRIFSEFYQQGYRGHPSNSSPDHTDGLVPTRMALDRGWKYVFGRQLPDQLYRVGSAERPEDNLAAQEPQRVAEMKRWTLSGWARADDFGDERNPGVVSLLGPCYLSATLERSADGGVLLAWKPAGSIPTWDPRKGELREVAPERFALYAGTSSDPAEAHRLGEVEAGEPHCWKLEVQPGGRGYGWVVAEAEGMTLAASATLSW
jgi:arylsulfatase A-like enzyme